MKGYTQVWAGRVSRLESHQGRVQNYTGGILQQGGIRMKLVGLKIRSFEDDGEVKIDQNDPSSTAEKLAKDLRSVLGWH